MVGLSQDLITIQAGSSITPEQIEAVKMSTVAVLTDIDNKPSSDALAAMAFQMQKANMDCTITPTELDAIQPSVGQVMMSAVDSEAWIEAMNASVDSPVSTSGVDQSDIEVIVEGLEGMVTEIQAVIPQ